MPLSSAELSPRRCTALWKSPLVRGGKLQRNSTKSSTRHSKTQQNSGLANAVLVPLMTDSCILVFHPRNWAAEAERTVFSSSSN
eukprot:2912287-Amphidinium_carterae.1